MNYKSINEIALDLLKSHKAAIETNDFYFDSSVTRTGMASFYNSFDVDCTNAQIDRPEFNRLAGFTLEYRGLMNNE